MFQEAERILVEDVRDAYVYHETMVRLVKPWVREAVLETDENGITSIRRRGYTAMSTFPAESYIGRHAPKGRGDR